MSGGGGDQGDEDQDVADEGGHDDHEENKTFNILHWMVKKLKFLFLTFYNLDTIWVVDSWKPLCYIRCVKICFELKVVLISEVVDCVESIVQQLKLSF